MFITNNDVIDIKIYWKKVKNKYVALTESEITKKALDDSGMKKFNILSIKMVELSWGLYNQLQEDALDVEGENKRWNIKKFKENKLKKTIKEWDAKTDKGDPIPVNEKTILSLAPPIAETILRAYDDATFLSEEDEKN
jgi:hypothetical protein